MKRALFYIICFYSFSGFCQERFFKVFDFNGELDFATSIALKEDGYIIAGSFDTTLTKRGVGIVQYNDTGGLDNVTYKKFSKANFSSERITDITPFNGDFLLSGYFHESDSNPSAGFVAKYLPKQNEIKIIFRDLGIKDRP